MEMRRRALAAEEECREAEWEISELMAAKEREEAEALNSGSDPVSGRDVKGPTASLMATTEWNHADFPGGVAVNLRLGLRPDDPAQRQWVAQLVRTSLPLVDWYLYDCKETDAALHRKWTGVDNDKILANLAILDEANAQVVLRCPIIPGCNDREDHFNALGEMSRRFSCIRRIEILPYHPRGVKKSRELGQESPYAHLAFPSEADVGAWKNKIGSKAVCPVRRG